MLLISPNSLQIVLSATLPAELDGLKISNGKPLYGFTNEGKYLFQDIYCKAFHVCFINLIAHKKHKIILLKKAPQFFLMVQLQNSFECEFYNSSNGISHEWSINLFHSENIYAEISLQKDKSYSTFIFFIPADVVRRLAKPFPTIQRFYELHKGNTQTIRLHIGNPICTFQVMDLIHAIQFNRHIITIKTYVELITASFELLSKKNLTKQTNIDDKALQKLYNAKEYMLSNITENYSRAELCKKFRLTMYYFEKGFKCIYDVPPFVLMRFYRMSDAKTEIQKNNTGLKELAKKYHYTYNSFIRAYQSVYHAHPTTHKSKAQQTESKRLQRKNKPMYPKVRKK